MYKPWPSTFITCANPCSLKYQVAIQISGRMKHFKFLSLETDKVLYKFVPKYLPVQFSVK